MSHPDLGVYCLDVGQGDATIILLPQGRGAARCASGLHRGASWSKPRPRRDLEFCSDARRGRSLDMTKHALLFG